MMVTESFSALKEYHRRLKAWRPLHWCWWFERHGLPVPPYLVGGADFVDQTHYAVGDDDNADPDSCTFDGEDTPRTGQATESDFMVRLAFAETNGGNVPAGNYQLWVSLDNNVANTWQVTTTGSTVKISSTGTPNDQDPCNTSVLSACGTFMNGIYTDASDESGTFDLTSNYYTEFQFCVQFTADAPGSTDHYFFIKRDESAIEGYSNVAQVATEAGAGGKAILHGGALPHHNIIKNLYVKRRATKSRRFFVWSF